MYVRDIDIDFYSKTKRLRLVKPSPLYAPTTIQWISRSEVTKYLGADFSKMTVDDEVKHLEGMVDDSDCYSWMIELDGKIVGNIEINEIKELSQKYGVKTGAFCTLIGDPPNWRKGLGSSAKKAASNWAFSEGDFELIEAKAYIQNVRSWGALDKLGYHYEGNEKGDVDGNSVEWKVYTLKKKDWKELSWSLKQHD
jgi:RimJ/RimL family protein N-acetyltransferase